MSKEIDLRNIDHLLTIDSIKEHILNSLINIHNIKIISDKTNRINSFIELLEKHSNNFERNNSYTNNYIYNNLVEIIKIYGSNSYINYYLRAA